MTVLITPAENALEFAVFHIHNFRCMAGPHWVNRWENSVLHKPVTNPASQAAEVEAVPVLALGHLTSCTVGRFYKSRGG